MFILVDGMSYIISVNIGLNRSTRPGSCNDVAKFCDVFRSFSLPGRQCFNIARLSSQITKARRVGRGEFQFPG